MLRKVILIDGDKVRKYISTDLGYSLKERKTQVNRILGICKLSIESNLFPIASTVYLDDKILKKIDKLKICCVRINRNIKKIKSIRKIYTDNKNVVGKDIKLNKLKTINIINKGDKNFCKELLKLVKRINI